MKPIDLTNISFIESLGDLTSCAKLEVDLEAALVIESRHPNAKSRRDVAIDGRVALAPMAGVSVQAFRRQGRRHGAALTCTEMVSACGLHYQNERTQNYLRIAPDEHPVAVQIFGSEPSLMADAARQCVDAGADIIDINMGCPVKKVSKTGAGCSLAENTSQAVAVTRAVVDAVPVPVTVKIRRGIQRDSMHFLELGPRLADDGGAAALTLHPRSANQMYTGFADHALTRLLVEAVDVPVFASGDITDRVRAEAVMSLTGCSGVMIGRAAQGNPWVLRNILGRGTAEPSDDERIAELVRFVREVAREIGAERATGFLRKFYGWYLRGAAYGKSLRREIMEMHEVVDVEALLVDRFPGCQEMLDELDRTVRYPDELDAEIALPVSIHGGG